MCPFHYSPPHVVLPERSITDAFRLITPRIAHMLTIDDGWAAAEHGVGAMIKKLSIAAAALATTAGALTGTADAQRYGGYNRYDHAYGRAYQDGYNRGPRYYDGGSRHYSGRRNRRDNTTGTVIGGVLGGLLGNSVAGRGDRLLGTVIGGAGGALAGRAVDRSDDPRYCR